MNLTKGKIVTVFRNGSKSEMSAHVDIESGELFPDVIEHTDTNDIKYEKFVADNGDEYMVCDECHEFIITQEMCECNANLSDNTACSNCNDAKWY